MSTASDDVSSRNTETKIPTDIDDQPILWLGNPAHLAGLLDEFSEYIQRVGLFQPLIHDRAVLCGSKLAVESVLCVPFVKGVLTDKVGGWSFAEMAPAIDGRIAAYNTLQAAISRPAFDPSAHTSIPDQFKYDITVNKYAVQNEIRAFASCLANIIANGTKRQKMLKDANYDGFALLELLRAEAKKAKPQDVALVNSEVNSFVQGGLKGELTRASFDAHMKAYRKLARNQPMATRLDPSGVVQMVSNIMYHDPSIRQEYKLTVIAEKPDPDDLDANMDLIDELLRSREVEAEIDDLNTNGSKQSALVAAKDDALQSALARSSALPPDKGTALIAAVQSKDKKAILAALISAGVDPVKDLNVKKKKKNDRKPGAPSDDIPRDSDGKPTRFIVGKMEPCACGGAGAPGGTDDQGHHLYKDCKFKDHKERKAAANATRKAADQTSQVVTFEGSTEDEISSQLNSFFAKLEADHTAQVSDGVWAGDGTLERNDDSDGDGDDDDIGGLDGATVDLDDVNVLSSVSRLLGVDPSVALAVLQPLGAGPDHVGSGSLTLAGDADNHSRVLGPPLPSEGGGEDTETLGSTDTDAKNLTDGSSGPARQDAGQDVAAFNFTKSPCSCGDCVDLDGPLTANKSTSTDDVPSWVVLTQILASICLLLSRVSSTITSTCHRTIAWYERNHHLLFIGAIAIAILAIVAAAFAHGAFAPGGGGIPAPDNPPPGLLVNADNPLDHATLVSLSARDPEMASPLKKGLRVTTFLSAAASWLVNTFLLGPATLVYVALRAPISTATTLAFAASLPVIRARSKELGSSGVGRLIMPRVVSALNHVRHVLPALVYVIIALSPSADNMVPETSELGKVSLNFTVSPQDPGGVTPLRLPLHGDQTGGKLPGDGPLSPGPALEDLIHVHQTALPCASDLASLFNITSAAQSTGVPYVNATVDSGATASSTNDCKHLINTSACDEIFGDAQGRLSRATAIGDFPVIAQDSDGKLTSFTFTNVRCVPDFKYTLLSVNQLWEEQRVDCRWRDLQRVELPPSTGNRVIPFSPSIRLPTIVIVPGAQLYKAAPAVAAKWFGPLDSSKKRGPNAQCGKRTNSSLVGFHAPGSVSHVRNLSAAQAGELLHRRTHLGLGKMRALPVACRDATSNLTSAPACTCVHCAAANAKRAAHSGSLPTPTPEPGRIHLDIKGPFPRSIGGYMYAAIFIDEYSRFVWFEPLKAKGDVRAAFARVKAHFEATVGTPTDDDGKSLGRPKFKELRTDHEGGLMSHGFAAFREESGIHLSLSPPHDHDLNPIAERTIAVIDTLATAMRDQAEAPIGYWPWFINNAVEVHNAAPNSAGSSTADVHASPFERITLTKPKIMDLCVPGSRAVVLKAPTAQQRGNLTTRGEVGIFLGRSTGFLNPTRAKSASAYDVAVNGTVRECSSVQVDEEFLPWRGNRAPFPLSPSSAAVAPPMPSPLAPSLSPGASLGANSAMATTLLSLFSGSYHRTNGLPHRLRSLGWTDVIQIDNDGQTGGGHDHDLLNDSLYDRLLADAHAGKFHGLLIAFPCSTFSVTRLFDASKGDPTKDPGPPPVRSAKHPDGLPPDEVPAAHGKELRSANALLDRTVTIALAARASPAKTTIIFENPADRSDPNTVFYSSDVSDHGSVFATTAFKRLVTAVESSSFCTFAQCRVGGKSQKYTTLWYTNDAASVLDTLNGPDFKCNHPAGSHQQPAGGRDSDGKWLSKEAAAYPDELNTLIAKAFTAARTGSPDPPAAVNTHALRLDRRPEPAKGGEPHYELDPLDLATAEAPARRAVAPPSAVPLNLRPAFEPPASPVSFPTLKDSTEDHIGTDPRARPSENSTSGVQGKADRAVRAHVRNTTYDIKTGKAHVLPPASPAPTRPPTIPESPASDPSYLSFTGTPVRPQQSTNLAIDGDLLETVVSELIYDAEFGSDPRLETVSPWVHTSLPAEHLGRAIKIDSDTWVIETTNEADDPHAGAQSSLLVEALGVIDQDVQHTLIAAATKSSRSVADYLPIFHALRADSAGAPETHKQAAAIGEPWPSSEVKELNNHANNESWTRISIDDLPAGRRVHKLVWVYKIKRDGTAKARLCVQGCTLEGGVDYDQTFASALKYHSARALFALAARKRCRVRSVDFVAAYLQGKFVEGEVVYCRMPDGYVERDSKGRPFILRIEKPIYGIPQAGRRLQRCVIEWMTKMGLRQLEDSDNCVWVYDDPDGLETFTVGIYVDNLQIVHSAELDDDGNPLKDGTFYGKFISQLRKDWDIVDEGPMADLLGIQAKHNPNGSITLHQQKYIEAMLARFYPKGLPQSVARASLPYTMDIRGHVIDALEQESCLHPELVTLYQQRIGSLMYCCTATRPDIAFSVHLLCRCMTKPTPALMNEVDHIFAYLSRHRAVGITYSSASSTLHGFSDASWETRHSTSGWFIFWQDAALAWGSRKQHCIALSSCEAEIIALSEAAKDMVYFRKLIRGLDKSYVSGPSNVSTDNQAARNLAHNPENHERTKHVARRHFFVRDMVESLELRVPFVGTKDNYADFLTKPLTKAVFFALRAIFMNEQEDKRAAS
jgi:hypothetical protein